MLEWTWMGSAGYGDPLDRPVDRVVDDVDHGWISKQMARDSYGVVFEDGELDSQATERRRAEIRDERLDEAVSSEGGDNE